MKSASFERIVAIICFTILAMSFMLFMTLERDNSYNVYARSPYYTADDTVTVASNNILRANTIQNFGKWNVDSLTTAVAVDTFVMASAADKLHDNFNFQRLTGQIIINSEDSVLIAFPGTDFFTVLNGAFRLDPAFHDTLFYKTPGTALIKFQVLHTTIRTLR